MEFRFEKGIALRPLGVRRHRPDLRVRVLHVIVDVARDVGKSCGDCRLRFCWGLQADRHGIRKNISVEIKNLYQ